MLDAKIANKSEDEGSFSVSSLQSPDPSSDTGNGATNSVIAIRIATLCSTLLHKAS